MKKFEGMLFCTDLDGTIYSDDHTVSKENLEAIEYFKAQGGLFTFITGRVPKTSEHICAAIAPNAPYGCLNGGGIFDPAKGDYLWYNVLPEEMIELVAEVDRRLPEIGIQFSAKKEVYFVKDNLAMVWFRKITGLPNLSCHFRDLKEPVLKVVFGHESEEQIRALTELLRSHPLADRFDFIRSEKLLYEILPKGNSKGALLQKMAELLGISMGKTIAVGDYNNDVSMIRRAGIGFAVANAVEEAKAAADYITVSNNDHAIAAIVEGLDKGIYVPKEKLQ